MVANYDHFWKCLRILIRETVSEVVVEFSIWGYSIINDERNFEVGVDGLVGYIKWGIGAQFTQNK